MITGVEISQTCKISKKVDLGGGGVLCTLCCSYHLVIGERIF